MNFVNMTEKYMRHMGSLRKATSDQLIDLSTNLITFHF